MSVNNPILRPVECLLWNQLDRNVDINELLVRLRFNSLRRQLSVVIRLVSDKSTTSDARRLAVQQAGSLERQLLMLTKQHPELMKL
jgi:hypothetical protein